MAEETKDGKPIDSPKDNKPAIGDNTTPKVEIEIKRHEQLFDLLSDPKRMWRVLLSLFLIIVVLFWGIAFVVIAIKKYYPYNVIETNIQGATTMKTEDKEVIYWLFNTADLWANSGIEVKEGDELTIRASGASFTAIHHLVDASEKNYSPNDHWVGTEGQKKDDPRDRLRAEFRINKNYDEGILLMQIIPSDSANNDVNWLKSAQNLRYLKDGHIEIIGKERRNLRISKNGKLHFAVNDIVLTDSVINRMYSQYIDTIADRLKIADLANSTKKKYMSLDINSLKDLNNFVYNNRDSVTVINAAKKGLSLGYYPAKEDFSKYKAFPLINELVYYKEKSFRDAWYVDNIGSFLIVIERKKQ